MPANAKVPGRFPTARTNPIAGACAVIAITVLFLGLGGVSAAQDVSKEHELKAAFLYNFAKFVEWPLGSFAGDRAAIVIAVWGDDSIGRSLEAIARGKSINGHPVAVRMLEDETAPAGVHILFVSKSVSGSGHSLAGRIPHGVLSVGETAEFLQQGGVITFHIQGDKLRFDLNMAAAGANNLRISAQMQKLATPARKD